MKFRTIFLATALALSACTSSGPVRPSDPPPANVNQNNVKKVADAVVRHMQRADAAGITQYVHPTKGVRFTPYTHVNVEFDRVVTSEGMAEAFRDQTVYTWGTEEGSGFPIEKTFLDYYIRYVFDHDYANAERVRWNTTIDYGGIIDNAGEVYPNAEIVEYHFPGFDPQYGGMDWRSLRLVFEKQGSSWYLVGVIHDEWSP